MSDEQRKDVDDYIVRAWSEIDQVKRTEQDRSDYVHSNRLFASETCRNDLAEGCRCGLLHRAFSGSRTGRLTLSVGQHLGLPGASRVRLRGRATAAGNGDILSQR